MVLEVAAYLNDWSPNDKLQGHSKKPEHRSPETTSNHLNGLDTISQII